MKRLHGGPRPGVVCTRGSVHTHVAPWARIMRAGLETFLLLHVCTTLLVDYLKVIG